MGVDKSFLFSDRSLSFSFIPPSDFLALRETKRAPTTPLAPTEILGRAKAPPQETSPRLARPDFGLSDAESIFLSNILKLCSNLFYQKIERVKTLKRWPDSPMTE